MLKKLFNPTLNAAIILVYIVVIAGAIVRMTGSGMGCPDWPKCFGYYIPPTQASQLAWQPNHDYKKGQVIILNESLRVVKEDFNSKTTYQNQNWETYDKHNYAIFNPIHTWVEYINRLATVIFGIPILLLCLCSITYWRDDKRILLLALAALISVAFEAWLGKIVVDTNLLPVKITLHVLFVFFIIGFLLALKNISQNYTTIVPKNKTVIKLGYLAVIITLVQVIMGTQVRQYVDLQMDQHNHLQPQKWLQTPPLWFYIHRTFSILVIGVNVAWLWFHKKQGQQLSLLNWVFIFIILEALSGIILYYANFPFLSQPLHLLLSSLLFGVQFFALLRLIKK